MSFFFTRVFAVTLTSALSLGCMLAASPALSAPLAPADFSWRAPIEAPAGASLLRVELPAQAMQRLQTTDARDVRVFNAAGEAVAYAWLVPAAPAAKPAEQKTRAYAALPLYTGASAAAPKGSVQVHIDGTAASDRSVWVRMQGDAAGAGQRLNSVLVDMRQERTKLAAIDVQGELPANMPVRVTVSTSADLASWTAAPVRGRLYRFDGDGAPVNARLEFERPLDPENRYLRLDWSGQDGVSVTGLTGLASTAAPAPRRVRAELALRETGPDTAEVATGFATPMAAIALAAVRDNTLVPVRVLGRNDASQPWRLLGQTVVYHLGGKDDPMNNPPLDLNGASARILRVVATNGAALAPVQLQAFAEFVPMQLVFIASGEGPFTLAAGRDRADAVALPTSTLAGMLGQRKLEDVPLATVGAGAQSPPSGWAALWPGGPGKTVVLWGVLLIGVLLLAGVAWSLLRQMNAPRDGPRDGSRDGQ